MNVLMAGTQFPAQVGAVFLMHCSKTKVVVTACTCILFLKTLNMEVWGWGCGWRFTLWSDMFGVDVLNHLVGRDIFLWTTVSYVVL